MVAVKQLLLVIKVSGGSQIAVTYDQGELWLSLMIKVNGVCQIAVSYNQGEWWLSNNCHL